MEVKRMTAQSLVSKLKSPSEETLKEAVCELRLLAKWDNDNRICIAEAGAIPLLLDLLYSLDAKLQENAITALLNLSIYPENRERIMGTRGGLDAIAHVLKGGASLEAKQNASTAIFSLLVVEDYRSIVGDRSDVTRGLLDLIRQGSARCTKDALKALFHMALYPLNRPKLVSEGLVPVLFSLLMNASAGVIEDATAVIAQVAGCGESAEAFRRVFGVQVLVDLLETGSPRAQENAASALLNLAQSGGDRVVDDILDVDSSMPVISDLLTSGTPRAKGKVSALLKLLLVREHRPFSATF